MVDYNIEIAHIYTDQHFDTDHSESASYAAILINKLIEQGKSYNISILIDNYNPQKHILDTEKFIEQIKECGVNPDYLVFEADLKKYAGYLNKVMDRKLAKYYSKYLSIKNKYPCSFLLSIWHMLRLGLIKDNKIIHKVSDRETTFYGKKSVTILPYKYEPVEKMSQRVILSTEHLDRYRDIEYIYF